MSSASRIAKENGLTLRTQAVDAPSRSLPDAGKSLTQRRCALGTSDSVVMTLQTAEPILLSTLRNKNPARGIVDVVGQGRRVVRPDRDYPDIGSQCGEIAGKKSSAGPVRRPFVWPSRAR